MSTTESTTCVMCDNPAVDQEEFVVELCQDHLDEWLGNQDEGWSESSESVCDRCGEPAIGTNARGHLRCDGCWN